MRQQKKKSSSLLAGGKGGLTCLLMRGRRKNITRLAPNKLYSGLILYKRSGVDLANSQTKCKL